MRGVPSRYSAQVRPREPPYETLSLTFGDATAAGMAGLLTGVEADDGFGDKHESAPQETRNIMTSGFVDGVANTPGRPSTSTPLNCTTGPGPRLSSSPSRTAAPTRCRQRRDFEGQIYLVPDQGAFVNPIDGIELDERSSAVDGGYVDELDASEL